MARPKKPEGKTGKHFWIPADCIAKVEAIIAKSKMRIQQPQQKQQAQS